MSEASPKDAVPPRFPGESLAYRRAREELLGAEAQLRRHEEDLAEQRRALPLGGTPPDYAFEEWDPSACAPRSVRLSELFADGKRALLIYSFMFNPGATGAPLEIACPLCTSMVDGLDGVLPHVTERVNVAVATKAPIARLHAHAHTRGWRNARLLSTSGTSYNRDYGAERSDSEQLPMASIFVRPNGVVRHFWSSELLSAPAEPGNSPRHVDFMWPLWAIFDRTPEGRGGDWWPSLAY